MDREIDRSLHERRVELLREETLATGFGQRAVLDGVASGLDDGQGQLLDRPAERAAQPVLRLMRLGQGERAPSRPDHQGSRIRHSCSLPCARAAACNQSAVACAAARTIGGAEPGREVRKLRPR
jgi:hypothetical protein